MVEFPARHAWDVSPAEARAIQQRLRSEVIVRDEFGAVERVGGVDVGFVDNGATTRAAVAILSYPRLELIDQSVVLQPTQFPYVPGLLSFREVPAVLAALRQLQRLPDLLLCDGQGLAHPRRFGIACHLGVLTGIPSIGVAKTRLTGTHGTVPDQRGAWVELRDADEVIGAVVRTRAHVKPLFISVGYKVSLKSAVDWTLRCTTRYRLPETTRHAHRLASQKPKIAK